MQNTSAWARPRPIRPRRPRLVVPQLLGSPNQAALVQTRRRSTTRRSSTCASTSCSRPPTLPSAVTTRNYSFTMPPTATAPPSRSPLAHRRHRADRRLETQRHWLLSQLSDAEPYAARNSSSRAIPRRAILNATTTTPLGYAGVNPPRRRPFLRRRLLLAVGLVRRMMEPLSSQIAVMTTGGNHEIGSSEAWQSYNFRYPMPHDHQARPPTWWS